MPFTCEVFNFYNKMIILEKVIHIQMWINHHESGKSIYACDPLLAFNLILFFTLLSPT